MAGSFVLSVWAFLAIRGRGTRVRDGTLAVDTGGRLPGGHRAAAGSALGGDAPGGHRRGHADLHLQQGLHARRSGLLPFLRLPQPLRLQHAACWCWRSNYLLLYFGWEAVGLCSYYLIGFYYHKPSAASAGKKAFITNRVGDFGFGLGVMLIFVTFGSLDSWHVFEAGGCQTASAGSHAGHRPPALHGSHGQVGPVPPARVAA